MAGAVGTSKDAKWGDGENEELGGVKKDMIITTPRRRFVRMGGDEGIIGLSRRSGDDGPQVMDCRGEGSFSLGNVVTVGNG